MNKKLASIVFNDESFIDNPPVLVDVGASGEIHKKWKGFSKYCIALVFDPDSREFGYVNDEKNNYKKIFIFNSLVHADINGDADFFLTQSPFCSSTLPPDHLSVAPFIYADAFKLVKTVKVKAMTLSNAIQLAEIKNLDWLKLDTQGTDLRIIKSLSGELLRKVVCIECEPGIMPSYLGEDKAYEVISYFDKLGVFWCNEAVVKGVARINKSLLPKFLHSNFTQKLLKSLLTKNAGWMELSYLRSDIQNLERRELLLLFVASFVNKQYGFCLEILNVLSGHDFENVKKLKGYVTASICLEIFNPISWVTFVWKKVRK